MTWLDLWAWGAGGGTLLYFFIALWKPMWFLGGTEEGALEIQDDHKHTRSIREIFSGHSR